MSKSLLYTSLLNKFSCAWMMTLPKQPNNIFGSVRGTQHLAQLSLPGQKVLKYPVTFQPDGLVLVIHFHPGNFSYIYTSIKYSYIINMFLCIYSIPKQLPLRYCWCKQTN